MPQIRHNRYTKNEKLRVPGFLPSCPNWAPHPLTRKRLYLPLRSQGGGGDKHSLAEEGMGGNHSDEGADTLVPGYSMYTCIL